MLDSAGNRAAEQGQLQFLAERRERLDIDDGCRQRIPHARRSHRKRAVDEGDRRVSGKTSVDVAADRRRRREATSAVRCSISARYGGAVPCRQRCVRTRSRNWILSGTFSQCSSQRSGVVCSDLLTDARVNVNKHLKPHETDGPDIKQIIVLNMIGKFYGHVVNFSRYRGNMEGGIFELQFHLQLIYELSNREL